MISPVFFTEVWALLLLMSEKSPGDDERYCRECGAIILVKAEICPECGVRQQSPPGSHNQQPGQNQRVRSAPNQGAHPTTDTGVQRPSNQSYGLVFSFIDSWKYQKPLRHLLNALLALSTVGAYLLVLLVEGLIHYRNLNNGDSEPYDESKQKVWTTFTDVQ